MSKCYAPLLGLERKEDEGEIDLASLVQTIPDSLARQKGTSNFTGPSLNPTGECHFLQIRIIKCIMEGPICF